VSSPRNNRQALKVERRADGVMALWLDPTDGLVRRPEGS
jgi:hypothetical protein